MSEKDEISVIHTPDGIVADVRSMIESSRETVSQVVNAGLTILYWRIGKRIQSEVLEDKRAEYGKEIVATLSHELTTEFGRGFERSSLARMVKFAETFPEGEIVASMGRQFTFKTK